MAPLLVGDSGLVVVQGDTSTALGGALASVRASVPLAHVEAGLRTGDRLRPWPEEAYRVRIDRHAQLLFAATPLSASNLAREGVAGEVHITGNTGVDALLSVAPKLPDSSVRERAGHRLLVTCHRRESWRDGLHRIGEALLHLARDGSTHIDFVVHPNPHVATQMRSLLQDQPGITLLEPCSHPELVQRMSGADIILSDSGGMQEEAPTLGIPLLVLRDKSERPEGISSGNMRLVGTSAERIISEVRRLLDDPVAYATMSRKAYPYGDGRAAPRIAAIIENWLKERGKVAA
ncbi:UDP-N-acetylglucosamine 2-epimerase (non-hydrolyzing) [Sphingomonas sp. F9_3S_D5_B_2]